MLDETFAEAFVHRRLPVPARFRARLTGRPLSGYLVCGLRLRPFSRWHAANLDFIQSPFTGHKENRLDFAALYLAAECCRLRFPQTLQRGALGTIRHLLARPRYEKQFPAQLLAFCAYLRDYGASPELVPGENAAPVKTPWYLYEVCVLLQRDPRLTNAQAWDAQVGAGKWWLTGHAEAAGNKIDFVTPEDREQLAELGVEV